MATKLKQRVVSVYLNLSNKRDKELAAALDRAMSDGRYRSASDCAREMLAVALKVE